MNMSKISFKTVFIAISSREAISNALAASRSTGPTLNKNIMQTIPPILALVIGNDKYMSDKYTNLSGSVADADHFEAYLQGLAGLGTRIIDIISLRNASRRETLNGFRSLQHNYPNWKDEAAIVVFYAGHGARTAKPEEWVDWETSTGEVEMLCPSDIGMPDGSFVVEGVYDRTISALLNQLAAAMGPNITLIMDCCCSGGITRGDSDPMGYVSRGIEDPPPASPKSDQDIFSSDSRGGAADGSLGKVHQSHVLLAACGQEENAYEDPKTHRGYFTTHLLSVLEGVDAGSLTYTSLVHKLSLATKLQTPRCEGHGVTWRLFNNHLSGSDWSFILTRRDDRNVFLLEAGIAQGISVGSRLSAHSTNIVGSKSEGEFEVKSVTMLSSTLEVVPSQPPVQLPDLLYSRLIYTSGSHIKIYCRKRRWLESTFPPQVRNELGILVVDDPSSCDLELVVSHGKVSFRPHHEFVTPHLEKHVRYEVDITDSDTIRSVVCSSRAFYYHLTRPVIGEFPRARMELKELDYVASAEVSATEEPPLMPTGNNLLKNEPATIVVDEEAVYGMTIANLSDHRFYPFVFYFDPTKLTIEAWYPPPFDLAGASASNSNVEQTPHMLQPKSSLGIGYGASGVWPWGFSLHEDNQVLKRDLGFFRVFLSNRPAPSFFSMTQMSPFDSSEARAGRKRETSRLLVEDGSGKAALCGAQLATVVLVDGIDRPKPKRRCGILCF
ncbi:hypothetical protein NLJ89_g334 [Agrocybe chaxingu]|uniref:Peptidase C14 caspase domain-containing protein n=1 Tax=Agrocybe chaxingu TaxID=84603 RepID=A0A9W8TF91_9AGAR|nr:hypothetical protein NLJ89_g334 [Agrocybe chaxingu]